MPRIKKFRQYPAGTIVVLFGYADGENGPSASDFDQPIRLAKIVRAIVHPNNPTWTTDYVVAEPTGENASGWGDPDIIKPGEIHRLATAADIEQAIADVSEDTEFSGNAGGGEGN